MNATEIIGFASIEPKENLQDSSSATWIRKRYITAQHTYHCSRKTCRKYNHKKRLKCIIKTQDSTRPAALLFSFFLPLQRSNDERISWIMYTYTNWNMQREAACSPPVIITRVKKETLRARHYRKERGVMAEAGKGGKQSNGKTKFGKKETMTKRLK